MSLSADGFRKIPSLEGGSLRIDKDEMEFAHPYFIKGNEIGLELIKRKVRTAKTQSLTVIQEITN